MKSSSHTTSLIKVAFALLIAAAGFQFALAQGPGQRQPHDSLFGLKRALSEAGAPALSTTQEDQLKTLITGFQTANPHPGPSDELKAAQDAYDNAILAGDAAAAQTAAATIASLVAAEHAARQQALINFQIAALNILKSGGDAQVTALTQKFSAGGVVRLLGSLAGGGFRPGPGGPGGFAPFGGPGGPGRNFSPHR
ncbi:MAG: hypothetical protein U0Z53_25300 [Blastocatellia bacterium]